MPKGFHFQDDVSLVLSGSAGQGVQTVEKVLMTLLNKNGYYSFATGEYMSRVRGGSNSTEIRISNDNRQAYLERIDICMPMDKAALEHISHRLSDSTIVIADPKYFEGVECAGNKLAVPIVEAANEVGGVIFINTIIAGIALAIFDIDDAPFVESLRKTFAKKGEEIVEKNVKAAQKGKEIGQALKKEHNIQITIKQHDVSEEDMFLNGTKSVALGAVAGGCNFIASYPMSPSTGVLNALAEFSQTLDIVVEQAEDEISAINMGLGAWYAGARAIVTTSGGGFALMVESLSLAGMMESPMVIHLAQRPGPATGLPTRTEQGDLNFALHAGHGEFPRVLLAPGRVEDGFLIGKKAFDLADKYQVPVIILTDQFFVDSVFRTKKSAFEITKIQKYFVETDEEYKRYAFSPDGLSPRGLPGFGDGVVCLDSDEHDEEGRITESMEMRVKMMNKRMHRLELLKEEAIPAEFIGPIDFSILVISWGSTYGVVRESVESINKPKVGYLHVKQVYPMGEDVQEYVKKAGKVIVVENNYSGQFARLLQLEIDRKPDHVVTQYDGMPFSVEFLTEELGKLCS